MAFIDKLKSLAGQGAQRMFLEWRRPMARTIIRHMPGPLREWCKNNIGKVEGLSLLLASLTPDTGIFKPIDDFQHDFMQIFHAYVQNGEKELHADEKQQTQAEAQVGPEKMQTFIKICTAFADHDLTEENRDNYLAWLREANQDIRERFLILATTAKPENLKSYLRMHPRELEELLMTFVEAPKPPKKTLGTKELLKECRNQKSVLFARVQQFEKWLGEQKIARFRQAIEYRFSSLDELEAFMNHTNEEIIEDLDLNKISTSDQFRQVKGEFTARVDQGVQSLQNTNNQLLDFKRRLRR